MDKSIESFKNWRSQDQHASAPDYRDLHESELKQNFPWTWEIYKTTRPRDNTSSIPDKVKQMISPASSKRTGKQGMSMDELGGDGLLGPRGKEYEVYPRDPQATYLYELTLQQAGYKLQPRATFQHISFYQGAHGPLYELIDESASVVALFTLMMIKSFPKYPALINLELFTNAVPERESEPASDNPLKIMRPPKYRREKPKFDVQNARAPIHLKLLHDDDGSRFQSLHQMLELVDSTRREQRGRRRTRRLTQTPDL